MCAPLGVPAGSVGDTASPCPPSPAPPSVTAALPFPPAPSPSPLHPSGPSCLSIRITESSGQPGKSGHSSSPGQGIPRSGPPTGDTRPLFLPPQDAHLGFLMLPQFGLLPQHPVSAREGCPCFHTVTSPMQNTHPPASSRWTISG